MATFKKNKINFKNKEIAEEFQKARERKKITLERAVAETKINLKYLKNMEEGCFNKLPAGIYRTKIAKEYSEYLKIDCKNFLKELKKEAKDSDKKILFFNQKIKNNFLYLPRIFKGSLIIFAFFLCLFYLQDQIEKSKEAPRLIVHNPSKDIVIENQSVKIIGNSEAESEVSINGEPILADANGDFQKLINLKEGINTITIVAKKKYGKESAVIRQILVKKNDQS